MEYTWTCNKNDKKIVSTISICIISEMLYCIYFQSLRLHIYICRNTLCVANPASCPKLRQQKYEPHYFMHLLNLIQSDKNHHQHLQVGRKKVNLDLCTLAQGPNCSDRPEYKSTKVRKKKTSLHIIPVFIPDSNFYPFNRQISNHCASRDNYV